MECGGKERREGGLWWRTPPFEVEACWNDVLLFFNYEREEEQFAVGGEGEARSVWKRAEVLIEEASRLEMW